MQPQIAVRTARLIALCLLLVPGIARAQEADSSSTGANPAAASQVTMDASGGIPVGQYECYFFANGTLSATPGLNFAITGPGTYSDVDGAAGTYTFDPASQMLTFVGAATDGQHLKFDGSHNPKTLTYVSPRGTMLASCDLNP